LTAGRDVKKVLLILEGE